MADALAGSLYVNWQDSSTPSLRALFVNLFYWTGALEDLHSENLSMRVAALRDLQQYPSGDMRVLSYLEALLDDKTACIVMRPYRFGEIRWLSAYALAAERKILGIKEPVCLKGVVRPLDTEEFDALREAADIEDSGGVEGVLESFPTLREMGRLPIYDLEL